MTGSVERFRAYALIVVVLTAACTPRAGEPSVTMPATASALAVAPDFSGTIWAATGKRVYRSRDGGHSWRVVPGRGGATGVAFLSTRVVTVGARGVQTGGFGAATLRAPRPVGVPLVAVATPYYRTSRLYGIDARGRLWVSRDFGATFQRVTAAGQATAVAATTDDQRLLLVASRQGIELSRNRGHTFAHTSSAGDVRAIAFDLRNWRLA